MINFKQLTRDSNGKLRLEDKLVEATPIGDPMIIPLTIEVVNCDADDEEYEGKWAYCTDEYGRINYDEAIGFSGGGFTDQFEEKYFAIDPSCRQRGNANCFVLGHAELVSIHESGDKGTYLFPVQFYRIN